MWYVDHNNYSARTDLLCCTEMNVRQPSLHVRICSCLAGPHHFDNHKRYTLYRSVKRQSRHIVSLIVSTSEAVSSQLQSEAQQQKEIMKKRQIKSLKVCSLIVLKLFTDMGTFCHFSHGKTEGCSIETV